MGFLHDKRSKRSELVICWWVFLHDKRSKRSELVILLVVFFGMIRGQKEESWLFVGVGFLHDKRLVWVFFA